MDLGSDAELVKMMHTLASGCQDKHSVHTSSEPLSELTRCADALELQPCRNVETPHVAGVFWNSHSGASGGDQPGIHCARSCACALKTRIDKITFCLARIAVSYEYVHEVVFTVPDTK